MRQDVAGLPRVRPETVAIANPPVGLAGPTDRSRNADELPPTPSPAQRTMLALYAPHLIPRVEAPSPAPKVTKPAPVKVAAKPGAFGAHIGSFGTSQGAERAWSVFGKKYETLKGSGDFKVVPVDLGAPKGVMYRLIASPGKSRADVRRVCEAVKSEGGYCRVISVKS